MHGFAKMCHHLNGSLYGWILSLDDFLLQIEGFFLHNTSDLFLGRFFRSRNEQIVLIHFLTYFVLKERFKIDSIPVPTPQISMVLAY